MFVLLDRGKRSKTLYFALIIPYNVVTLQK